MNTIESVSLPQLLAAITQPHERTTNGWAVVISRTVQHQHIGNVVWAIVRDSHAGIVTGSYIVCWEIEGDDATGWTATPMRERHDLRHVTCPLEYLQAVPVWSAVWRDRVWHHHEAALTRQNEGRVAG